VEHRASATVAQTDAPDLERQELLARLEQAEATIRAIQNGEVDAVLVNGASGPKVYTLEGADHPYRVMVEHMYEGTATLDSSGVILYSNRQLAAMTGAELDSIAGSNFDRFIPPGSRATFAELHDAAAVAGHSSGDLNLRNVLGETIPARVSLTTLDLGGMQATSLLVSDLRGQRRNEAMLKEEQLARMILDQAGEAIVVIDPRGAIIRRSHSAKNLAGRSLLLRQFDEMFPLTIGEAVLDTQRILATATEGDRIRGVEVAMAHRDGRRSSLLLSASPLWSSSRDLLGCVITLTDITSQKRAEQDLARQAEQLLQTNSDLRQFAHSASHDLREPVRQLAVFSELLQKKYKNQLDAEALELVGHSVNSARRIESLLKGLLEYTQAAGAPLVISGECDANEVLRNTLEIFEVQIAQTGARVERDPLPELPVHEVHLTQIFQNLIGNALKYRSDNPPVIRVSAEANKSEWRLSVADNGIGIMPEYREKIFGLFQRLHGGEKYQGNGLGLAICQKIVQRYGGRIWVEPEPAGGSKFIFTVPRTQHDTRS